MVRKNLYDNILTLSRETLRLEESSPQLREHVEDFENYARISLMRYKYAAVSRALESFTASLVAARGGTIHLAAAGGDGSGYVVRVVAPPRGGEERGTDISVPLSDRLAIRIPEEFAEEITVQAREALHLASDHASRGDVERAVELYATASERERFFAEAAELLARRLFEHLPEKKILQHGDTFMWVRDMKECIADAERRLLVWENLSVMQRIDAQSAMEEERRRELERKHEEERRTQDELRRDEEEQSARERESEEIVQAFLSGFALSGVFLR